MSTKAKQTPLFPDHSEASPQRTRMIGNSVLQLDLDERRKKPLSPVGASREGRCAYCGAPIWHVSVTSKVSGTDYSGVAVHGQPEWAWLPDGGFGWIWLRHGRYCMPGFANYAKKRAQYLSAEALDWLAEEVLRKLEEPTAEEGGEP